MISKFRTVALAGALVTMVAAPASALTLPIIGDVEHPDMDPFHILTPPAPEAPAATAEKPAVKHHHHHKKKKM